MLPKLRPRTKPKLFVFLGPDGAGKSTVINSIIDRVSIGPHLLEQRHLKLHVWFTQGRIERRSIVTDPHRLPARGTFSSILKITAWALGERIYWTLYSNRRPSALLLDRYFDDLLADPTRYRYGGPKWVIDLLRPLLPRPTLCFILIAPADVIQLRKQEVSRTELESMLRRYVSLGDRSNAIIVDVNRPLSAVVNEIEKRLRFWLRDVR